MNAPMITLTLLAVLAIQPSQPPSPRGISQPQPKPAATQEQPSADPRGTEQSPLIVKVQPAPKTDADAAKEQGDSDKQSEAEGRAFRLALLSGGVALLQALLIGAQIYLARQQNRIIQGQSEIMEKQAEHMSDGLKETRLAAAAANENMRAQLRAAQKSADAATQHANLIRQQVVGTIGAVVRIYHNVNFGPIGMHIGFINDGSVTATNVKGSVEIMRVTVPDMTVVETPTVVPFHFASIAPKVAETINLDIITYPDWILIGKDSRADVWATFVTNPRSVRIRIVDLSYGNGFGDQINGDQLDMTYMPAWEVKTEARQFHTHHGSFQPTELLPEMFRTAKRMKDEEAQRKQAGQG